MAFIVPALTAIGGGSAIAGAAVAMSAVGAIAGGVAQSNQYKSQAKAAEYNALMGRQQASAALTSANQREEQQRRAARVMSGERRAAIAQSGAGLGGSNADVDRQSEVLAELDALNIRYEGQVQSTGLLNQSELDTYQAKSYKSAAKGAITKGVIGAASTMLSRAG